MNEIKCSICGSFSKKLLLRKDGRTISQCKNCGFVYTSSKTKKEELNKIYQDEYFHIEDFNDSNKHGYRSYSKDREFHRYYFGKKLDLIKKYKRNGKILDVGCALGFFMEKAKEEGFDPYGIDVSAYAISFAKKKFPGKAVCSSIDDIKFKENNFDVVSLFQTIEHLDNPLKVLKIIHNLLKSDGVIAIACPNHDSILRKMLGRYWFEYKPQEHLNFFDIKSLSNALNKTNFEVIYTGGDVFYYSLNYIFERMSYYSPNTALKKFFSFFYFLSGKTIIKNLKIPLPFGGIIVIAAKR